MDEKKIDAFSGWKSHSKFIRASMITTRLGSNDTCMNSGLSWASFYSQELQQRCIALLNSNFANNCKRRKAYKTFCSLQPATSLVKPASKKSHCNIYINKLKCTVSCGMMNAVCLWLLLISWNSQSNKLWISHFSHELTRQKSLHL